MRNSKKGNAGSEREIRELRLILTKLLWENQACHILLFEKFGHNFKHSIDLEKNKIKNRFVSEHQEELYGKVDNRFVTVVELVNKNKELMSMIK